MIIYVCNVTQCEPIQSITTIQATKTHLLPRRSSSPHLPKGHHHAPAPPTTLWNPASLVDHPADSRRKLNPATPPSRPPPGLTRVDRPPLSWGEKLEEGGRRRGEGTERGASLQEAGSWNKAEQDRAIQSLYQRHHMSNLHQRACAPPSVQGACPDPLGRSQASSPSPVRERQSQPPDSMLVYDEVLQQHRRLLSKLDMEEKRRKEAREGGEHSDEEDESYDESDEEEVKAHLRRVTKQPPLKLDASSEVQEYNMLLITFKVLKCLLERYSPAQMSLSKESGFSTYSGTEEEEEKEDDEGAQPLSAGRAGQEEGHFTFNTYTFPNHTVFCRADGQHPELHEKKDFLHMFNLSHVSPQQRRGKNLFSITHSLHKERTEELLSAIQKKTVTLDTLRYNPLPPCSSPPAPSNGESSSAPLPSQSNGHHYPDSPSPSPPYLHKPKHPPITTHSNPLRTPTWPASLQPWPPII
ncbi:hypothetical protein F7725_022750 [Dissostichus mawsoni]|uniref:Genetic suppressor element-like domain-containing protein n=1 Tax=Dissostichus mawsoni TaxID=36200 RepID=A0A7J5YYS2_DISMA|nr:hypothetical protein F7725_022750 [Dissostichus mawsoni]